MYIQSGFAKLNRKVIADNPVILKDADYFATWCWLNLNAVFTDTQVMFGGKQITLHAGQLTTGRKVIADELKIHESKVQRILKSFETEHLIEQATDRRCRLVSILSEPFACDREQANEHLSNICRTSVERPLNSKEESEKYNNTHTMEERDGHQPKHFSADTSRNSRRSRPPVHGIQAAKTGDF